MQRPDLGPQLIVSFMNIKLPKQFQLSGDRNGPGVRVHWIRKLPFDTSSGWAEGNRSIAARNAPAVEWPFRPSLRQSFRISEWPHRDPKMARLFADAIVPIWVAIRHSEHSRESGEPGLTYDQALTPNAFSP